MPYIVSIMRRTSGAATSEPNPACSTMATTTYFGSLAGTIAANHDVSWNSVPRYAVPVLPATGISDSGNPRNGVFAVPLTGTCVRASRT